MEGEYKIETKEELIEKINEEIEILESIYADEGVILSQPQLVDAEAVSTGSSGKSNEEEEHQAPTYFVQMEINVKPKTGIEMETKVGLLAHFRFIFDQYYPFNPPQVICFNSKGIDEEQLKEVKTKIN